MTNVKALRIFFASDSSPNAAFPFQSDIWRNNLYLPLVDLGHDVVEFEYDFRETFQNLNPEDAKQRDFIAVNRPKLTRELLRQIRAHHSNRPIDLFFSYFYDACVLPEAIDEIRSMGIVTVNWYCNASYQLHLVSEISPHYDWCLVPEKFRLNDYVALGARPIYCQEAANPNIYKRYDLPYDFDVTFVGQKYGERPTYIRHLLDADIDVRVWGMGWQPLQFRKSEQFEPWSRALIRGYRSQLRRLLRQLAIHKSIETNIPSAICGPPLSDQELIKMFRRSLINLGFSTVGETHKSSQPIKQIRLRDFEVPMSGGFYLLEYMEEIEEFFEPDKEIVCYHDKQDLVDKIKYYLAHDTEREAIRQAGHRRAVAEHTWHKRFQMAFAQMGLNQ